MNIPHVTQGEDGAIWIEFSKNDRRFTIVIEKDITQSSWNYVSYHGTMECENLPEAMIKFLKEFDEG